MKTSEWREFYEIKNKIHSNCVQTTHKNINKKNGNKI